MSQDDRPIRQKMPYVCDQAAGNYAWCRCGQSAKHPFCDGAHRGGPFRPEIVQLESTRKVAWCGCGRTAKPPFCDGTHAKL